MRLLVFGAGAVGSLFGGLLSEAGSEVWLVTRGAHLAAVVRAGLTLSNRRTRVIRVRASSAIPPGEKFDLVLLTVKSFDVREAGRCIAQALSTPVPVVALQNGLHIASGVEAGLRLGGWPQGAGPVFRALNTVPALIVAAGSVREPGTGELVLPGSADGQPPDELRALIPSLRQAGLSVRLSPDIQREEWKKLLVNAAINPVTADHGVVNGALLDDPLRGQAEQLLREAQRAAGFAGYTFTDEEADQELWKVVRATAQNRSSMLQDVEHGRRTEIDAISGAVAEEGRRQGLVFRATERVLARIRAKHPLEPPAPSSEQRV